MSGECNYCGGEHAEGACQADRDLIYNNGYSSGFAEGHNSQNDLVMSLKAQLPNPTPRATGTDIFPVDDVQTVPGPLTTWELESLIARRKDVAGQEFAPTKLTQPQASYLNLLVACGPALMTELVSLRTQLAEAQKIIAGEEKDKDSVMACLLSLATGAKLNPSHVGSALARVQRFKKERDEAITQRDDALAKLAQVEKERDAEISARMTTAPSVEAPRAV